MSDSKRSMRSRHAELYAEWLATGRPTVKVMAAHYGVHPVTIHTCLYRHPEYRAYQMERYPNRGRRHTYPSSNDQSDVSRCTG